jgi:N-acetyl-anhydromuramyl-L-alanine amidase AmpD
MPTDVSLIRLVPRQKLMPACQASSLSGTSCQMVIHYTADDFDTSLATLTDKNVSSHYLIPAKPPSCQMRGFPSGVGGFAGMR